MTLTAAPCRRQAWLLASLAGPGCSPLVSLDTPEVSASSGPGTTAVDTGSTTAVDTSDTSGTTDRDLGPADPPIDQCPAACSVELVTDWVWDGPVGEPVDPNAELRLMQGFDNTLTVADQRGGRLELARVDQLGQGIWTLPLDGPCDPCRLAGLEVHTSGDAIVSGYRPSDLSLLVRVELGEPAIVWQSARSLVSLVRQSGAAGNAIVASTGLIYQPVVDSTFGVFGGLPTAHLALLDDSGSLIDDNFLGQLGPSVPTPPPTTRLSTDGTLVISHARPGLTEGAAEGLLTWSNPNQIFQIIATSERDHVILDMAAGNDGQIFILGRRGPPERFELMLAAATPYEPQAWEIPLAQAVDGAASWPALAADLDGHAHVVLREGEDSVRLLNVSTEGELVWDIHLPRATAPAEQPLALLVDIDTSLLLGTLADAAVHVERLEPRCACPRSRARPTAASR